MDLRDYLDAYQHGCFYSLSDDSAFLIPPQSNLQSLSCWFDLSDGIALVAAATLFPTSGNLGLSSRNTNHHIFKNH